MARYRALLARYLRPQRRRATLLGALVLATIVLQLINPQIVRFFIDRAMAGAEVRTLVIAGAAFLAVGLLHHVIATWATYVGADVGWTATNMLREDLAAHLLGLDMGFHNHRTPGELIERIDGDITALSNFFSVFVIRVLGSGVLIIGVVTVLSVQEWRMGLAMAIYVVVAMLAMFRARNLAVAATGKEREASASLYGFVEERLNGLEDIRANGGGRYTMRRFAQVIHDQFHFGRRAWMMRSLLWVIIIGVFTVGDLVALGVGIGLFGAGIISLGSVYLFYQYAEMTAEFVEQISQQLQEMQKALASIVRVDELLAIRSRLSDGPGTAIPTGALAVEFNRVTFAYGAHAPVLDDVDFRLAPGTVLGLLGRTGSGKTTLTRLLFRLYEVSSGAVRVGGVDTRDARMRDLRGRVAMVTQEVQLFHASVRDNLSFFDHSISDERMLEVIERLDLGDWFSRMPDGLDTMLTTGGGGLSAGEAQLLAFTRVFLQDPGLVVLDEPSSRMDLATERLLERAMQRLLEGRTAIIIAHRLSTVARADEIMVLDHGRIVEHGRRAQLESDPDSHFAALLRTGRSELVA